MVLLDHRVSPPRSLTTPCSMTPVREQSDTRSNPPTFAMFQ